MSISRYIVEAVASARAQSRVAAAPVELAQAEMAVGDEGSHAELVGESQRRAVVGLRLLDLRGLRRRRDMAKHAPGVRLAGCPAHWRAASSDSRASVAASVWRSAKRYPAASQPRRFMTAAFCPILAAPPRPSSRSEIPSAIRPDWA